jgi:hypothetical protein
MLTIEVQQGKAHNVQAYFMKSKVVKDTAYSNASNIEIPLTIIHDEYLMEQAPSPSESHWMWWIPS